MRILNRIVRIEEDGLYYEADPRHIDLIAESLNITAADSVCTPGLNNSSPDSESDSKSEDDANAAKDDGDSDLDPLSMSVDCGWGEARNLPELLCAMTCDYPQSTQHISFNLSPVSHGVPPPFCFSCKFATPFCFSCKFATRLGWRSALLGTDRLTGMPKSRTDGTNSAFSMTPSALTTIGVTSRGLQMLRWRVTPLSVPLIKPATTINHLPLEPLWPPRRSSRSGKGLG